MKQKSRGRKKKRAAREKFENPAGYEYGFNVICGHRAIFLNLREIEIA